MIAMLLNNVYLRNKKGFRIGLLHGQSLSFKAYKANMTAIFAHLVLKLYKNKSLRCAFNAIADAADKGKLYSTCSTPELSERKFCVGIEFNFTTPLGCWCARNSCEKRYCYFTFGY